MIASTGTLSTLSTEEAIDSLSLFDDAFAMGKGVLSSPAGAGLVSAGNAAAASGTTCEFGLSASAAPMQSKHKTARQIALIIAISVRGDSKKRDSSGRKKAKTGQDAQR